MYSLSLVKFHGINYFSIFQFSSKVVSIIVFTICIVFLIKEYNRECNEYLQNITDKYKKGIKSKNSQFFADLDNQHILYNLRYFDTNLITYENEKGKTITLKQFLFTVYFTDFDRMDCLYIDANTLKILGRKKEVSKGNFEVGF